MPAQETTAVADASAEIVYAKAKRHLVVSCAMIAGGLAVAGSVDRTAGGVLLLVGWVFAVLSLHRLGRAGSERR